MVRTVAVAVAICGATLATQAMACDTASSPNKQVEKADSSAAVTKFRIRIGSDGALQHIAVQP